MTIRSIVVRREVIEETLARPPLQGKNLLEPLRSLAITQGLPFKILEDTQVQTKPEIHLADGDLWYCLSGEVEFTCGGSLVDATPLAGADGAPNPKELRGTAIDGGIPTILRAGDWLWIPPGEPHAHACGGTARMIIVKIPTQP